MKLIKPSYEFWEQKEGLSGVEAQIERAARVCYASEPKGEVGELLGKLIKSKHYAMLEHGTIYLYINNAMDGNFYIINEKYRKNKYSIVNEYEDSTDVSNRGITFKESYITTNYRVLVENNWLDDLKYLCEPTEYHEKRITVKFTMDRIESQSFCRHRVFSFAQESTRYCNYSKDKFSNEITFIIPSWLNIPEGIAYWHDGLGYRVGADPNNTDFDASLGYINKSSNYDSFLYALENAEKSYFRLLKEEWKPQQARQVLPNALKTELVMTGFVSDWKHFFDLRAIGTTGKPHPDAEILAKPLMNEFIERRYLNGTSNS